MCVYKIPLSAYITRQCGVFIHLLGSIPFPSACCKQKKTANHLLVNNRNSIKKVAIKKVANEREDNMVTNQFGKLLKSKEPGTTTPSNLMWRPSHYRQIGLVRQKSLMEEVCCTLGTHLVILKKHS